MTRRSGRRTRAVWFALLAVPLALLTTVAAPARPTVAADAGLLAYLQSSDGGFSRYLYVSDTTGAGARRVTGKRAESQPSFSPTGDRIAFAGPITDDSDGRYAIYTVGLDGSNLATLTAPQFGDLDPAYSPDGSRIAFTRYVTGRFPPDCCAVFVMNADGSGQREIPGTGRGSRPTWSPDGTRLAYSAPDGVYVVALDGSGRQRLAAGTLESPAWSPDGSTIAVAVRRSPDESRLALVPAAGGLPRVLLETQGQVEDPNWTGDGSGIYAVVAQGQGVQGRTRSAVWRFDVAGGTGTPLFAPQPPIQHLALAAPGGGLRGTLESLTLQPGGVTASGWALDPESSSPVPVRVTVDGVTAATTVADSPRPDVAAAFPGAGPLHGFRLEAPVPGGTRTVCLLADRGAGPGSTTLGCRVVTFGAIGNLESVTPAPGGVQVAGWAIDTASTGPATVDVLVDGRFGARLSAGESRPDVAAAFPAYGGAHGYRGTVAVAAGPHRLCAYVVRPATPSVLLRCQDITVADRPVGTLDTVDRVPGGLRVRGWTLDSRTDAALTVHVYLDGRYAGQGTADARRPDVAAAFPAYGPQHGVDLTVAAAPGAHTVCLYALNPAGLVNPVLGCTRVVVDPGPVGSLDETRASGGQYTLRGWALDPDTQDPIAVHVLLDGGYLAMTTAGRSRPDVAAAFPAYGAAHGYDVTVDVPAGRHQLCVWGIDNTRIANRVLGCTVTG